MNFKKPQVGQGNSEYKWNLSTPVSCLDAVIGFQLTMAGISWHKETFHVEEILFSVSFRMIEIVEEQKVNRCKVFGIQVEEE